MSAFLTDQEAASSSSIPQASTQPQPSPSSTDASLREILDQLRTLTLNQPNPNTEAPVVENPAREVEVLDGLPPLQKVKLPFPPRYDGTREVAVINAWIDSITDYFLLTQIQDGLPGPLRSPVAHWIGEKVVRTVEGSTPVANDAQKRWKCTYASGRDQFQTAY